MDFPEAGEEDVAGVSIAALLHDLRLFVLTCSTH